MKKTIIINNTELTLVPTEVSDDIYLVKKDVSIIGWVGDAWEMVIHDFIDVVSVSDYPSYVFKPTIGSFDVSGETLCDVLECGLSIIESWRKKHTRRY